MILRAPRTGLRFVMAATVGALVFTTPALAKAKKKPPKPTWVVLVHSEGDVPSSWADKIRASAEKADARNWTLPPAVTLDEAAGVVGCTWSPACAAQVADMTGADNVVLVEVKREGAGASVSVEAVSADGSSGGTAEHVAVDAVDDAGLDVVRAFVAGAVKGVLPTLVVLTADLDPTEVVIDNVPAGKTPLTLVDKLTPGPHEILFKREGKAPLTRSIEVKPGVVVRETAVLSAGGPAMKSTPTVANPTTTTTPTPATEAPSSTLSLAGWGLTGVGALAAVGGGVYGALTSVAVASLRESSAPFGFVNDVCEQNGEFTGGKGCGGAVTSGADRDVDALLASESRQTQNATTGFVIAGIGVVVAATGLGLALATAPGEDADAATTSASTSASR